MSNIAVQVYEYSHARQFTSKPTKTASLGVNQFALLASRYVLSMLLVQPKIAPGNREGSLEIGDTDYELYTTLSKSIATIHKAMELYKKRPKTTSARQKK